MKRFYILSVLFLLLNSCATYKPQYKGTSVPYPKNKEVEHTFYLIGDAGNSDLGKSSKALQVFKKELNKASKNSTALFLGDNIYQNGMPEKSHQDYELAKHRINIQIDAVKNFKGNPIFIAGNHDWYSGLKGLERQEKIVKKALGKSAFLPKAGCGIDNLHISNDIELILIDTQWYLTNWNKHPTINDNCNIKTRDDFFNELSSLVKKARGKTTIVALHHPIFTNGAHGCQFSFADYMKPFPILGTLKNVIRTTSGISTADLQNKRFIKFKQRLITIAQENKNMILVSGHEHNLQYIIEDNIHQIISGSGSKLKAVRNRKGGLFGYATSGYAKLDVFKDGSSHITFYSVDDNKVVFENEVLPARTKKITQKYPTTFPKTVKASIYTKEETNKSKFHKFLWGDRYRKYYSIKVTAPTVDLDTLFGGLTIGRQGGGTQSKSLRLITKDGKKQYVMRAMRKQGTQFIQASAFKNQYVKNQFENTSAEDLVMDVFTGSHPYAPFVIGDLSDAIGIYHLNPKLYYIPKQKALGDMNALFGNELYMIEEHGSDGHGDKASFGFSNKVSSTIDVMKKLKKDEDYKLDEATYIRARLFDMLIGDWDRHQDQWRWVEFKENGKTIFKPLPRDRDQSFSIMSDGVVLGTAVSLIPNARILRKYSDDLVDVKGTTIGRFPLDVELIRRSDKTVWDTQVQKIREGITDEVIDKAFSNLPKEVIDESVEKIKKTLKARRKNLQKISDRYYKLVNKYVVIKGTNKDDWFDIKRLPNGKTEVTAYRIKKGKKGKIFHQRTYNCNETKEIWIYGLDDEDVFEVSGKGDNVIKIRLIGGQNNDTYDIKNGKRVVLYDFKSKKNTIVTNKGTQKLVDDYHINTYNYKKLKNNTTQFTPTLGANPDDGFKIGGTAVFTKYGFERNPFTSQHKINANYYFATKGYEVNYSGEFARVFQDLNIGINAQLNSPNYATNFFGMGNESINPNAENESVFNKNYNRVKIRTYKIMPSLIWRGQLGGNFKVGVLFEGNKVERTKGRFIETLAADNSLFDEQNFYGIDAQYHFENKDNRAFPTLGFQVALQTGYKNNLSTSKGFGYILPSMGFDYKLIPSGRLVLATHFIGHLTLGNDFEFYQGATLGANNGLRGYRNQRFTGKNAFAQSTDIRWNFGNLKNQIIPVQLGIYGGVDYGRVWIPNDSSNKWNNSYGGGFFINLANMMTANISTFNSNDGVHFAFNMGFGF